MTGLEEALVEMVSFLNEMHWPYMLIGGLAVALWGEPRATLDVDISVWIEKQDFEEAVRKLGSRFRTIENSLDFARQTRVVPLETTHGIRVDVVFAALPEERRIILKALTKMVGDTEVRLAAPEDLILMKLMSERAKDLEDARRLIRRFRRTLDRAYLEPQLQSLAEALARTDILDIYRAEAG